MADSWNVGTFISGTENLKQMVAESAVAAVADIAEWVLGEAIQQVPHEDGDLQASNKISIDEENKLAAVSFDTPYAVVQHEDMTFKHDAGRKAKYLEDPMNAVTQGPAQALIARHLKGA